MLVKVNSTAFDGAVFGDCTVDDLISSVPITVNSTAYPASSLIAGNNAACYD